METSADAAAALGRSVDEWLAVLALGLVAGSIGQLARVVVGMKKAREDAMMKGMPFSEMFDAGKLWMSVVLGAIAGALAAIQLVETTASIGTPVLLGLVAAGYAGSDFIEGMLSRYLPSAANGVQAPTLAKKE